MPLTGEQRYKLQELSLENGGAAFSRRKANATTTPTLIIGLGGLGGETLNTLKRKVNLNLKNTDPVFFLALDADETDLKKINQSKDIHGYLNDDEIQSLYNPATGMEPFGAQGRRQIGHLMLTYGVTYQRVREKILRIVQKAQYYSNNIMKIIIVSGISGGAGSGTLSDVAYMIHDVMKSFPRQRAGYHLSAYIYTPDVQLQEIGIAGDLNIREYLMVNGYAALKEIDYYMNISEPVFDACVLVSSGNTWELKRKKTIIDNLTEHLLELVSERSYNADDIPARLSPVLWAKNCAMSNWFQGEGSDTVRYPREANYSYQILGYSAVNIPEDEIVTYLINGMYQKVYAEFKSHDKADPRVLYNLNLADTSSYIQLALNSGGIRIDFGLCPEEYPTRSEIAHGTDSTIECARQLAGKEAVKINDSKFKEQLKNLLLFGVKREIERVFCEDGPYAATALLTEQGDGKDIIHWLKHISEQSRQYECMCIENSYSQKVYQETEQRRDAVAKFTGILRGKESIAEYVEYVFKAARIEIVDRTICRVLREVLEDVIHALMEEKERIWKSYTEVLDKIHEILELDAAYVANAEKHSSRAVYDVINLYDGTQKAVCLKNYLDNLISQQSVNKLQEEFLKSMRDVQRWTDVGRFDVVSEVRNIFEERLADIYRGNGVQQFLTAAYDTIPQQAIQQAANEIAEILNVREGMMINMHPAYHMSDFLDYHVVITSSEIPSLSEKVKYQYIAGLTANAIRRNSLKFTSTHWVYNAPLYILREIGQWYEAYHRRVETEIGLHIDEVGQDWKTMPEPYML